MLPFCFSAFRSIDFCCFATDWFSFDYLNTSLLMCFLRFGGFFVLNMWCCIKKNIYLLKH